MKKKTFQKYNFIIGNNYKIITNNNFKYEGEVKEIYDDILIIDDYRIDFDEIKNINDIKNDKIKVICLAIAIFIILFICGVTIK